MTKVLIFGDSIAWGAFDEEHGGWVERLKTKYLKTFKEEGVAVYNLAVSSNDTRGVLFALEKEVEIINFIEPEEYVFLFSIGSNDPLYVDSRDNVRVPFNEYKNNLKKIVELSKKYASRIIFTGLLIVDEEKTMPWSEDEFWENKDLRKYDDAIKEVCENNKIDFIPLWDLFGKDDLYDGLHPNSRGHEKIFNRVASFLEKQNLIDIL